MKQLAWAAAFLGVMAIGGLAYQDDLLSPARSQTSPAGRQQGVVPVRIATAEVKPTPVQIDTIGTVQTIASVAVKSRLDAVIDMVIVQDGQYVKAGDVLFQLDSRVAETQMHQAEAVLARDQAQLANAQRDVERYKSLVSKDFVSRQQFDTSSTTARALEATVQADQAQLENMKVLLSYYTIKAPIDGRVGMIAIKRGNSIKSNDVPLATVNQIMPIYVSLSLPQINLPELRAAMQRGPVTVQVVPQGDKGAPVEGKVAFFDNTIDTTSGTISVRASFDNEQQRLWPGQFVNASVLVRTDADALVVPPASVQVGQKGNFVFVIKDDNTAETRPVTVDRTVAGQTVISNGLKAGEKVVIDGQLRLNDGTRVQIVSGDTPKPGSAS
jgi:membrane fusion protein, multidrug efflux system